MKMFGFFRRKKNKGVVIDGKNIIINDICINEVFSECISRLDEAIKKQDFENVADVKSGLEKILKELDCYDDTNCEISSQKNVSFFNFGGNVTQQISSVTTSNGKKTKIKQSSFFNKGNMVGGNITIQQSNINGDNVFKG